MLRENGPVGKLLKCKTLHKSTLWGPDCAFLTWALCSVTGVPPKLRVAGPTTLSPLSLAYGTISA